MYDIRVYFLTSDVVWSTAVKVKGRLPKNVRQEVVYEIKCYECNAVYM